MKLNLEGNPLNGYKTVLSQPYQINQDTPQETDIVPGYFHKLDPICPDGEAEEIIFNPPLNILPANDIITVIEHWAKKLAANGILKINFIDIRLAGLLIHRSDLELQQIDMLIFGPAHEYQSVADTNVFKKLFEALGFKISSISTNKPFVAIEAGKI